MHKVFLWAGLVATIVFLVWLETRTCKREVLVGQSWIGAKYFMCEENYSPGR